MAAVVLAVLWLEQKHCNLHERMVELPLFQSRAKCLINQLQFNMRSSCKCAQATAARCLGRGSRQGSGLAAAHSPKPMKSEALPLAKAREM